MLSTFYQDYFAKDKVLRHYTQHLLVATIGFILIIILFHLPVSWTLIIAGVIFSILPDVDGLITIIIFKKRFPHAKEILNGLRRFSLKSVGDTLATHHKEVDRLLIHNFFGVITLAFLFYVCTNRQAILGIYITSAVLIHFLFDIVDDYVQLGHIRHWIWPLTNKDKSTLSPVAHTNDRDPHNQK